MKPVIFLLVLVVAGVFCFVQKKHEKSIAAEAAVKRTPPRQVYEHDWAKHSIDKTNSVLRQVKEKNQSEESP
jgi:hypothetical protein